MRCGTRGPVAAVVAAVLAATLSGCITVHGERAVVPAATRAEAARALERFTEVNNKANRTHDAELNATIETGPLGAIDQAGLRARHTVAPDGDPGHRPLELTDARFLIPRQAGWPKFFVADTRSDHGGDRRWLLVFTRGGIDEVWKVSYLAVLAPGDLPEFSRDGQGYVEAVPAGAASGLAVAPGELSRAYTAYLRDGGSAFADGRWTSGLREERKASAGAPGARTEWTDTPTESERFAPVGLRTRDGGALVFFTTHHYMKQTVAKGYTPRITDPHVKALLEGVPERSVTYARLALQSATVPAADRGGTGGGSGRGEIAIVFRLRGLLGAEGG